jgi:hypothetical protein
VKPSDRIKELRRTVIDGLMTNTALPEIERSLDLQKEIHILLTTREQLVSSYEQRYAESPHVWLQAIVDYLDEQMLTPQPWVDEPGTDALGSCDTPDTVPR